MHGKNARPRTRAESVQVDQHINFISKYFLSDCLIIQMMNRVAVIKRGAQARLIGRVVVRAEVVGMNFKFLFVMRF